MVFVEETARKILVGHPARNDPRPEKNVARGSLHLGSAVARFV